MHRHVALLDIRSTIERQLKQARESLELLKQPKPSTFCGKRHHPPPIFEPTPPIRDWVDAFRLYPLKEKGPSLGVRSGADWRIVLKSDPDGGCECNSDAPEYIHSHRNRV